jgi:ribosomal protein S18 acetylase RimI-like enzyme
LFTLPVANDRFIAGVGSMIHVSIMTNEDIPFAISLTDIENWGNAPADFERLISLEPEGCYVARLNDEPVGMITTTSADNYGFIGSLIIKDEYRRQGIGETLMLKAISYLQKIEVEYIELDATFEGIGLYRRLGFHEKYLSLRLTRENDKGGDNSRPLPRFSMDEILELDARLTGLNRKRMLTRLMTEFRDSVYTYKLGHLRGYAVVFPRAGNLRAIGPLVAESLEGAESLIQEIVESDDGVQLAIGLPQPAQKLTSILLQNGFQYRVPSLRMYLGPKFEYESAVYGIASPEKG